MPNAEFWIISQLALAFSGILEILLQNADYSRWVSHIMIVKITYFKMWNLAIEPIVEEVDPCEPNPCGPNSNFPRVVGDRCECSCQPQMIGSPPNCRPECTVNSDCPSDRACINRKCQDPCPGLCGVNAYCRVRNHIPICVCNKGYTGDPFSQCQRVTSKSALILPFFN